jgi:hypothetical protein
LSGVTKFRQQSLKNSSDFSATDSKNNNNNIPVTEYGGPYGCEMSRLPHFLDNRLTDGGEAVGVMSRLRFIFQQDS